MAESPEGHIITPGVGSITDAKGNTYTLSVSDLAIENGAAMAGGSNTAQMVYHAHTVYGQDAKTLSWYTWNGRVWTEVASPISTSTIVASVTVATISTQRVGTAFTVRGTFAFDGDNPVSSLQYMDDKGAAKPANATVVAPDVYTYSFVHSGYTKAGTYTLTVGAANGATAKSNTFQVIAS